MSLEDEIRQKAFSLGFDLAAVTSADDIDSLQIQKFKDWLNAGYNGRMDFLARNFEQRFSPVSFLPDAKSVICVALNYKLPQHPEKNYLKIASYALYPDYHEFVKDRLAELADFLKSKDGNVKFKICVGSSPLTEKALAMRAGLGFIGKNRLLTNPKLGSFILLGEIITNMQLKPDKPIDAQACGNCRKCIEACPTGALLDDNFDAGRCISYLTMRCKGEIDTELKKKIGLHLFGCDECMLACPYNGRSPFCAKQQFGFTAKPGNVRPDDVIGWTEKDFEDFAGDSAILQIGLDRMKRNALICRENQK